MSPEKKGDGDRISFEDIASKAREVALHDGKHVPILIVEGSKKMLVSHIQEIPDTHSERMELMRFFGRAAAKSGMVGKLEQVFFISEGWMNELGLDRPQSGPRHDASQVEAEGNEDSERYPGQRTSTSS